MDTQELIAWLEQDEARSRPYRADRLRLLLSEYGPECIRLFPGGPISATAFEEARQAYLHGLFLACTIMSQVCVEHMLAGLLRISGRDNLERVSFEKLLVEARDNSLLSSSEFELFERLRRLRNPYVHPRRPVASGSPMRRAVEADSPFDDLVVEDARLAITALLRLCQRSPFALPATGAT